jgi:hypothetical protein
MYNMFENQSVAREKIKIIPYGWAVVQSCRKTGFSQKMQFLLLGIINTIHQVDTLDVIPWILKESSGRERPLSRPTCA